MANEVVIEEYSGIGMQSPGVPGGPGVDAAPIPGVLVKTQTLNIAVASAALSAQTSLIRLQSNGLGFWYALGTTAPTVTAATSPARWLPADQFRDIPIRPNQDVYIQTAA